MKTKLTSTLSLMLLSILMVAQNNLVIKHDGNSREIAECPVESIYSQPAILPHSYMASSEEYNVEVFTYFEGVESEIKGIRFWGNLIDFDTFTQYDPPENFIIRFYDGTIEEIGDSVGGYSLLIDGTELELNGNYIVWTFDATFPTGLSLATGWVSIQNTDPVFSFWWRDTQAAPDGKSMYVNHNNGVFYTAMFPHGFCLTDGTVSINDQTIQDELEIYPNPATDFVNIQSESIIDDISVFNNIGQLVAVEEVGNKIYKYNCSELTNGLYFIKIQSDNKYILKQLIKK